MILVVCTGNICRSPLAERLLQGRLARRATVSSAGTRGMDAWEMDPLAAGELARLGGDRGDFRSRGLTADEVRRADLVLTMTSAHRSEVLAEEPAALHRTFTLLEFADLVDRHDGPVGRAEIHALARRRSHAELADYDVTDPYGADAAIHAQVADRIAAAVDTIAARLCR